MQELSIFLPKGLLDHFDIIRIEELGEVSIKKDYFEIELVEKNVIPEGYDSEEYESKGFYPEKRIQDFPVRGKALYLKIKRRVWRNKKSKEPIKSDYDFITQGSKLTEELSAFLKGTGRDPRRYDK